MEKIYKQLNTDDTPPPNTPVKRTTCCTSCAGHGVTWFILIVMLALTSFASSIYVLPLINKAHVLADDAQGLVKRVNERFSLVDLIEEQVLDIDTLMPKLTTTVANVDSTAQNVNSNMDELMPRIQNTVSGIDAEVRTVKALANKTSVLVDNTAVVLAAILETTLQANATLVGVQAQARALDALLHETNQTLQEIKATQRQLAAGSQSAYP